MLLQDVAENIDPKVGYRVIRALAPGANGDIISLQEQTNAYPTSWVSIPRSWNAQPAKSSPFSITTNPKSER